MWRKSSNTLVKRIVRKSLFHYLPGTTQDQTKISRMIHFEVTISQSSDHCYMYIMLGTRPDIAFAVIKMLQYSSNPMEEHLQKGLYIVRYLSSTKDLCIQYSVTGNQIRLCAYSDIDWAGDVETLRSTTSYVVFLGNGIVSWLSRQQWRVTLCFTEVKYCGMTEIAKQLHWIHNVYKELGFKLSPLLHCIDNEGAMFLASNPAEKGWTKYIQIPEHYIYEVVELGEIKLYYVPTDLQFTNIFTKNLGKQKFQEGRKSLHLSRFYTS